MKREYNFSKGKKGAVVPKSSGKTRITIRLDTDVLDWFREQVHEAGGGSYQALINQALRSGGLHDDQGDFQTLKLPHQPTHPSWCVAYPGHPSLPDLESVLRIHLLPQLSHEIHHAMRRRAIGYGSTLLQAAVSEGLADHFALEASGGSPPPWTQAMTPAQLAVWIPEVVSRSSGSYDHAEWFFGTNPSIPRWTGYAVGFELVRADLDQDPDRSASALVGEPAGSFVPNTP